MNSVAYGRAALHKIRVYVDTSVFGGTQDEEFAAPTKAFFEGVAHGKFVLLISEETIRELFDAPDAVRSFWEGLSNEALERVVIDDEVKDLAEKYTSKLACWGRLRPVMRYTWPWRQSLERTSS